MATSKPRPLSFLSSLRNACLCRPMAGFRPPKIKQSLALNFVAVPKGGKQYGEKGWLFAILARILEDRGLLEHNKNGSRAFYRAKGLRTGREAGV